MLSLPLVSPFPLGPSLCQGSLLRPGGLRSRLLHPGGLRSRLHCPGGLRSRLLRPGGLRSRLPHRDLALRSTSAPPPTCIVLCLGASGSRSLVRGSVRNHLDTDSPPEVTRSPHCLLHHTTAAHHPRTAFPIHHCTNHTSVTNHSLHWLHSWLWSHTLQKPWTSPLSLLSIVSPHPVCLSPLPCLLPGLFIRFWSFAACLFDPACLLISSVCRLPRPKHCPCCEPALPTLHLLLLPNFACLTSSCVYE